MTGHHAHLLQALVCLRQNFADFVLQREVCGQQHLGNQCECTLEGGEGDIYSVAAVKDGKTTLMLTRYNGDNNACNIATVNISVKGYRPGEVVYCHLTDDRHNYTEIPLFPAEDGTVRVKLCNNSIAIVEF